MSIISEIFKRYRQSLDQSQDRYEDLYRQYGENARQFYDDFLHSLIQSYAGNFRDQAWRDNLRIRMERFFTRGDVDFAAIDGSCFKDQFQDFVVFYGGAYGVKGQISLEGTSNRVRYRKWSMDQDVSLVAYVPVPYAEVGDALGTEEDFALSEDDKVNLSNNHTRIMQLGEIYLAHQLAKSSTIDHPSLILMDLSPSSVLMSTDVNFDQIRLVKEQGAATGLTREDVAVAYSHPVSASLGIPSHKEYRRWSYVVGKLHTNGSGEISIDELAGTSGVAPEAWVNSLSARDGTRLFEIVDRSVKAKIDVRESWNKTVRYYEDVCYRMFRGGGDASQALLYPMLSTDSERVRWMSPDDISFLVAVGLRALIEECWQRDISLVGIVKDSSSRYFSRHFYGVMRHEGIYPDIPVHTLPWTDRTMLESIALSSNGLEAPWCTVEFDSCFMTLHLEQVDEHHQQVVGMRGNIVNQERLFARSLAQFYLNRSKSTPLAGHVIFVDRLLHPLWDAGTVLPEIGEPHLGTITPFGVRDAEQVNSGQQINMFLLDTLCRNLFPEVIGYPDPLHKADWGAKSMSRRVRPMIESSAFRFRSRPLSRLFRTTRDEAKRP